MLYTLSKLEKEKQTNTKAKRRKRITKIRKKEMKQRIENFKKRETERERTNETELVLCKIREIEDFFNQTSKEEADANS